MIAPLAKFIDWSALQMAYAVFGLKHAPRPKWKLEEALELLNGPDFLPAARDPAHLEFDGPRDFKFPTPHPGEAPENNIVYGRLYRCAERWQDRPVIILLDGYPSVGYHSAFPLLARRFNRAGLSMAPLVAPRFKFFANLESLFFVNYLAKARVSLSLSGLNFEGRDRFTVKYEAHPTTNVFDRGIIINFFFTFDRRFSPKAL